MRRTTSECYFYHRGGHFNCTAVSNEKEKCTESNVQSQQDQITTPSPMIATLNRMWSKFKGVRIQSKLFLGWQ
jgi:hypothetical protein